MDLTPMADAFTFADNAYRKLQVADVARTIEIEIGDSKQTTFFPQIKTMHWENECNFSARLLDGAFETPVVSLSPDGSMVRYATSQFEAHFYTQAGDEDGQLEFEIVLLTPPASNVIAFSIMSKGLVFMRQGPLTEEIDGVFVVTATETEGFDAKGKLTTSRPDNVVGSYAVYHASARNNFPGGQHYRTGKAFHIYRPQVIDARGQSAWGVLDIDVVNGLMTVTIPQAFLDRASYPVRHAAGLTIGYNSAGASTTSTGANLILANRYASPGAGDANPGTFNIYASTANLLMAGTYVNNAGTVDGQAKLDTADASITPGAAAGWVSGALTWTAILASTDYFLAVSVNGGNNLRYDAAVGYSDCEFKAFVYTGAMPATFPSGLSTLAREHSFYVDYTAPSGVTYPQLERLTRGLGRGMPGRI